MGRWREVLSISMAVVGVCASLPGVRAQSDLAMVRRTLHAVEDGTSACDISLSYDGNTIVSLKDTGRGSLYRTDDLEETPLTLNPKCRHLMTDSQLGGVYALVEIAERSKNLWDLEYFASIEDLQHGNVAWRLPKVHRFRCRSHYIPESNYFAVIEIKSVPRKLRSTISLMHPSGGELGKIDVFGWVIGAEYDDGPVVYFAVPTENPNVCEIKRGSMDPGHNRLQAVQTLYRLDVSIERFLFGSVDNLAHNRFLRLRGTKQGDLYRFVTEILVHASIDQRMSYDGELVPPEFHPSSSYKGQNFGPGGLLNQIASLEDASQFEFVQHDVLWEGYARYPSFWNRAGVRADLFCDNLQRFGDDSFVVTDATLFPDGGVITLERWTSEQSTSDSTLRRNASPKFLRDVEVVVFGDRAKAMQRKAGKQ